MRVAILAAAALAAAALGGCRDGVPPFTPVERVLPDPSAYQLTFGGGSERDPVWAPSGDTLFYQTDRLFGVLPQARGILAAIPVDGGTARVLFPEAQIGIRLLATPAVSPDGERVAYMEVSRFDFSETCDQSLCESTQARLDSARLRVRRISEVRSVPADPVVRVYFEGRTRGAKYAHLGPYYEPLIPLQAEHLDRGTMPFRPTWSPDGERLAYSDGLAVHVWRVGEAAAEPLPGTMDAVGTAWSPDGQWIAFTHLERGDSTTHACACGHDIDNPFINTRVLYDIAARTVVIMRPDGSERREVGQGTDPAWSPDNRTIYATHDDRIVAIDVASGAVSAVANTTRGSMPAVSPDGRWLALVRRKPDTQDTDVWVIAL
ncbi:MAG: PD40 domain-containing protein [Gemmatimonadetes bacterium]|nr:PD40 domain-containing protein [Gemmatimonadota bacterium]